MSNTEKERVTINGFVSHLSQHLGHDLAFNRVDTTHEGKRPDFIILPDNILVEIKGIHDRAEVREGAMWSAAISRLHQAIDQNPKKDRVSASFIINTPPHFRLPQGGDPSETIADQILDQIIAKQDQDNFTINIDDFEFDVSKYSDVEGHVNFGRSWGGSINAAGTVYENIFSKLAEVNKQLTYSPPDVEVSRRVLLLDSQYIHANLSTVTEALAYRFEDLQSLNSIDEIWLQTEFYPDDEKKYKLVVTKQFINDIFSGQISGDPDWFEMFGRWALALGESDLFKEAILDLMRTLFTKHEPHEVIKDFSTRTELVRIYGNWLVTEKRFDDAIWFIEAFMNDPNTGNGSEEQEFDRQIQDGEDVNVITTVLGHLAWIVQGIAVNQQHIAKALSFTATLAANDSLYIKMQSLFPLIEITKRRVWLKEIDANSQTSFYQSLKDLDFKLLRNCAEYPAIANILARVFFEFRDLGTKEIIEVLDTLKDAESAYALYVYFAIYREKHFLNADGTQQVPFDADAIKNMLSSVIQNSAQNQKLVGNISWQLAKIIRENPEQFDTVRPWIELLLDQPYIVNIYDDIEHTLPNIFSIDSKIGSEWYKKFIDQLLTYVGNAVTDSYKGQIWLSLHKVIDDFAKADPTDFLEYLKKLISLWKLNVYVGDIRDILTGYKSISNTKLRASAKAASKKYYDELKALNPQLEIEKWPR